MIIYFVRKTDTVSVNGECKRRTILR